MDSGWPVAGLASGVNEAVPSVFASPPELVVRLDLCRLVSDSTGAFPPVGTPLKDRFSEEAFAPELLVARVGPPSTDVQL